MSHNTIKTDPDFPQFEINAVTREIKNNTPTKIKLIQYDHNSERFSFSCPRYIENHDMLECNKVEVHYINIEAGKKNSHEDVYTVDDLIVDAVDEDKVCFSWLIGQTATMYVGSLNFLVRFSCVQADGKIDYAWNTAVHHGISISNGIYNSKVIVEEYYEVLEKWQRELFLSFSGAYSNAIKESLSPFAGYCVVENVSPVQHYVKLKVSSVYNEVRDTIVYVSDDNGTLETYIPNLDGTVDGVKSFSPKMVIWAESQRDGDYINIAQVEYNKDLNSILSSIKEEFIPKNAELVETFTADGLSTVYLRDQDQNGKSYDFTSMYVRIAVKPSASNLISVNFYDSRYIDDPVYPAKLLCRYQFANTVGNNGFMSIHADVIGGMWQAIATSAIAQGSPTNVSMWGRDLVPYSGEKIGAIRIYGASGAIEKDATITIYGVR